MDWRWLYSSPDGRIGRLTFRRAYIAVLWRSVLVAFIPFFGPVIAAAAAYAMVCIRTKRLHDLNLSGWLQTGAFALWGVAVGAALWSSGGNDSDLVEVAKRNDLAATLIVLSALVALGFEAWLALARGDDGPNPYGEAPAEAKRR